MRNIKKILALAVALGITVSSAMLFASCGGEENPGGDDNSKDNICTSHVDTNSDGKCDSCEAAVPLVGTEYTVTVVDDNNSAVSGVSIKLTSGLNASGVVVTDTEGKASARIEAQGAVFANVESLPAGYALADKKVDFEKNSTTLKITLTKLETETYTVKLVDGDGNAVEGVYVQVCEGETCRTPILTDANGVAVFEFVPNGLTLKARAISLPSGYVYGSDADPDGYSYFGAGETEITLTIIAE